MFFAQKNNILFQHRRKSGPRQEPRNSRWGRFTERSRTEVIQQSSSSDSRFRLREGQWRDRLPRQLAPTPPDIYVQGRQWRLRRFQLTQKPKESRRCCVSLSLTTILLPLLTRGRRTRLARQTDVGGCAIFLSMRPAPDKPKSLFLGPERLFPLFRLRRPVLGSCKRDLEPPRHAYPRNLRFLPPLQPLRTPDIHLPKLLASVRSNSQGTQAPECAPDSPRSTTQSRTRQTKSVYFAE